MRIPKQVSLTKSLALTISLVLLVSGIVYVLAAAPSSTFWLTPGVYPGAPSFTVWPEGSTYFAKNANGEIEFSGTNATSLIESVSQNDSHVIFAEGTYLITKHDGVQLWNVHNLAFEARGNVVFKKDEPSGYVGQILEVMRSSTFVRFDGITFDQDRDNPDHLTNPALGLQWIIRVGNGSEYIYFDHCKFINGEENNFVTGNGAHYYLKDCLFDNAGEHIVYLSAGVPAGTSLIDLHFDHCVFKNWGETYRGYVNVGQPYTYFTNCYFEPDANGNGINASSYTVVVGELRNQTYFEACTFKNAYNGIYVKGNNTRWVNCDFINTSLPEAYGRAIHGPGNATYIEGCDFYNYGHLIINPDAGARDWHIANCWFSGGVSSSIATFSIRTAIVGCIFDRVTNQGGYGINDASGDGLFYGNHVCNGTFTFNYPANVILGENIWDE